MANQEKTNMDDLWARLGFLLVGALALLTTVTATAFVGWLVFVMVQDILTDDTPAVRPPAAACSPERLDALSPLVSKCIERSFEGDNRQLCTDMAREAICAGSSAADRETGSTP